VRFCKSASTSFSPLKNILPASSNQRTKTFTMSTDTGAQEVDTSEKSQVLRNLAITGLALVPYVLGLTIVLLPMYIERHGYPLTGGIPRGYWLDPLVILTSIVMFGLVSFTMMGFQLFPEQ
jgi:hypothetical protein